MSILNLQKKNLVYKYYSTIIFPETVTVPAIVTSSLTVSVEPELMDRVAPASTFNFLIDVLFEIIIVAPFGAIA